MSLVENIGWHQNYKCGYCKSKDTNISYGIWAHYMTLQDYQLLLNRGWRRSGKYCYKPDIKRMCCPQHTIRCEALNYKIQKCHKKVIKKLAAYLKDEEKDKNLIPLNEFVVTKSNNSFKKGIGPDPNKPLCKKRKFVLKEKKCKIKENFEIKTKSLENLLNELNENNKKKLQIKLIPANLDNMNFKESIQASYQIYKKYQQIVHHDKPDEIRFESYKHFLVDSPLIVDDSQVNKLKSMIDSIYKNKEQCKDDISSNDIIPLISCYGTIHCHYLIDDVLVAVGVLDVLPNCLSSKYFYYDPDYGHLSLGVYSALMEIALVRKFNRMIDSEFKYYYMGYYIHSCPKMRYKAQYEPSFLLCTAHLDWHPIQKCIEIIIHHQDKEKESAAGCIIDFCHPNGNDLHPVNTNLMGVEEAFEVKADEEKQPLKSSMVVQHVTKKNISNSSSQNDNTGQGSFCHIDNKLDISSQLVYYEKEIMTYSQYRALIIYENSTERSILSMFNPDSITSGNTLSKLQVLDKSNHFPDFVNSNIRSFLMKAQTEVELFHSMVGPNESIILNRPPFSIDF